MSIYKEMYIQLFHAVSKTIADLQKIQQDCEQLYMDEESKTNITLANKPTDSHTQ